MKYGERHDPGRRRIGSPMPHRKNLESGTFQHYPRWFARHVWGEMAGAETGRRWRGNSGKGQNNHNEGVWLTEAMPATFSEIGRVHIQCLVLDSLRSVPEIANPNSQHPRFWCNRFPQLKTRLRSVRSPFGNNEVIGEGLRSFFA